MINGYQSCYRGDHGKKAIEEDAAQYDFDMLVSTRGGSVQEENSDSLFFLKLSFINKITGMGSSITMMSEIILKIPVT
jgi:hypothetical protein